MADFDDLMPSSSTAVPALDNPFENPFAIGRSRSPDPWAIASFQQTQAPVYQEENAFSPGRDDEEDSAVIHQQPPYTATSGGFSGPPSPTTPRIESRPPMSPIATSPPPQSDSFAREFLLRSPTSPLMESFRVPTSPTPARPAVDPLEALTLTPKEDTFVRRNPLGLLPKATLPPEPPAPVPAPAPKVEVEERASPTPQPQAKERPTLKVDPLSKPPTPVRVEALTQPVPVVASPLESSQTTVLASPLDSVPVSIQSSTQISTTNLPTILPPSSELTTPNPSSPTSPQLASRSSSSLSISGGSPSNYASAVSTPSVSHDVITGPNPNNNPIPAPQPQPQSQNHFTPASSVFPSSTRTPSETFSSTARYDRVVSPLETSPPPRTLASSFNSLALGGEVPGWGETLDRSSFVGQQGSTGYDTEGGTERGTSPEIASPELRRNGELPNEVRSKQDNAIVPTFVITVGDPQKVGDPLSAHILYTVHTRTTSPLFRKSEFSVLRRYSDFLWLFSTLTANNPGVVVPPVPEKHSFGRFQDSFVEGRRLALNKCITKIANHPLLGSDPDLKMFLESDSFALDIKHRKAEIAQEKPGPGIIASIGSTITGPKFSEIDEWFDNKKAYLDTLESQLRSLAKAVEIVSKHRSEVSLANAEFAESVSVLSTSELSKPLAQSLGQLAFVEKRAKELQEIQAKDDAVVFMGTVEEYVRSINSVRLAFASRVKAYVSWQNADAEAKRIKLAHEKARKQGKIPTDRLSASLAEIGEFERKAYDAKREFDNVSRLIKSEVARFELERIEDFKASLDSFLEGMISKQKELIRGWETYQDSLLQRIGTNPVSQHS